MERGHHDKAHAQGVLTIRTYRAGTRELLKELGPFKNKFVSSEGYGRNLLLRQMTGDDALPIEITSVALGDDDTPAADGDTGLGNELIDDIPLTSISVANNVLSLDVFVSDANLPDDTYAEFGLFATDRLMARIVIDPAYTKASGEDTLFSYELTISG
jgi:hypothetical protein